MHISHSFFFVGSGAFRRGRDRDLGGAFQYSRRGLRLRRRGAYGIHRASGPMDVKGCVERLHPTGKTTHYILCVAPLLQNVFAVHRFAQGAADWRSGPRWSILSVLCPVHPFPLRGTSPQGETRDMREKNSESYTSGTILAFSPFGGWRHHLPALLGSVSLDSQSPTAPCESSSLATTSWWDYGCLAMGPCLCRKA